MTGSNSSAFEVDSREGLADYLLELASRVERGDFPQENGSSVGFVKAAGYWIQDIEGFFTNQGKSVPANPDWALIAQIFSAAFVYE